MSNVFQFQSKGEIQTLQKLTYGGWTYICPKDIDNPSYYGYVDSVFEFEDLLNVHMFPYIIFEREDILYLPTECVYEGNVTFAIHIESIQKFEVSKESEIPNAFCKSGNPNIGLADLLRTGSIERYALHFKYKE